MGINRTAQYIKNTLYRIIVEEARILAQCRWSMNAMQFISFVGQLQNLQNIPLYSTCFMNTV